MSEISLANQIYIELREQILDGTIISNDIINEKSLALKYNVSKTPIREGFTSVMPGRLPEKLSEERGIWSTKPVSRIAALSSNCVFYLESAAIDRVIETADDEKIKTLYDIIAEPVEKKPKEKNPYNAVNTRFHLALAALADNHYAYMMCCTNTSAPLPGSL